MKVKLIITAALLLAFLGIDTSRTAAAGCTGVSITTGMSPSAIQSAVNTVGVNSTFCFAAGTYSNVSIHPLSGDTFDGGANQAAILTGGNTTQYAFHAGVDTNGNSTGAEADNITIKRFNIKKYLPGLQNGAIESFGSVNWTIENNIIKKNTGAGIATDSGAQVLNNTLDDNIEEGFAAHGSNILYSGNDISGNNNPYDAYAPLAAQGGGAWEAGGGKLWSTTNADFESNTVNNNGGPGLWADTNNLDTTFNNNTADNNWGAGLYFEISYNATVTNNTVESNGMPTSPGGGDQRGWLWNGGITLRGTGGMSSSTPSIVSGNTVTDNYNGITLVQSPVGTSGVGACNTTDPPPLGDCLVENVTVENNTITMTQGATGLVQDGYGDSVFSDNNLFIGNNYFVTPPCCTGSGRGSEVGGWLAWLDGWPSFAQWQTDGNDTGGSFST